MSIDNNLKKKGYDDYDVERISDGVYKINEFNLSTMFVIVGEERALVIDCGTGVGDYLSIVKKITSLPFDFVITHAHVDHIGGREQFSSMYLAKADENQIKSVTPLYRRFYILTMKCMGFKIPKYRNLKIKKVKNEPSLIFAKEGDVFDLGGKTVRVFETPGHTVGSLSYLLEENRIIFTGDVINPLNLMFLPNASSIEQMLETFESISEIEGYDTIWASHLSEPITSEILNNGVSCIKKLLTRKNFFIPLPFIITVNSFSIIYKLNNIHDKKRGKNLAKT